MTVSDTIGRRRSRPDADAPGAPARPERTGPRHLPSIPLPVGIIRPLLYVIVGTQTYRGLRVPLDPFSQSYWLVNYGQGFIRRGLTGSLLDLLTGRPTFLQVRLASLVIAAVTLVAVVGLLEVLLRRGTARTLLAATLLASSPFVIPFLASQRRPDELGIGLLIGLGLGLLGAGRRRALVVSAGVGLAFGLLVLVHEGVVLEFVPPAAALAAFLTATGEPNRWRTPVALTVVPSFVSLLGVGFLGAVDAATAARLRAGESFAPRGAPHSLTMFDFLPQSLHGAASLSLHGQWRNHAAMVCLGVVLLGLQIYWVRRWVGVRWMTTLSSALGSLPALVLGALVGAGGVALFVTGIDWIRWFEALGAAWLVTVCFVVLQRPGERARTLDVPGFLPVLGAYFVLLPLLPTAAAAAAIGRLILLRH